MTERPQWTIRRKSGRNSIVFGRVVLADQKHRRVVERSIPWFRIKEIESLIRIRYGGPCDLDDALIFLRPVFDALSMVHRQKPPEFIARACREWATSVAPGATEDEIAEAIARAKPRVWGARRVGIYLRLTDAERTAAKIRTIRAFDLSDADMALRDRQRRRERKLAKRREAGARPRAEFLAGSARAEAEWRGVSVRTVQRMRAANAALVTSPVVVAAPIIDSALNTGGHTYDRSVTLPLSVALAIAPAEGVTAGQLATYTGSAPAATRKALSRAASAGTARLVSRGHYTGTGEIGWYRETPAGAVVPEVRLPSWWNVVDLIALADAEEGDPSR